MRLIFVPLVCVFLLGCRKNNAKQAVSPATSKPSTKSSNPKQLTFLTYNVLADSRFAKQRIPALMKLLKQSSADIIALQEVTAWFLNRLEKQKWVRSYHKVGSNKGKLAPGGLYILSRFPVQQHLYKRVPSHQGRGFLMALLKLHKKTLAVGTVHLESPLKAGAIRVLQMKVAFSHLAKADESVLLGDFNFGDGEQPDTKALPNIYVDPWPMLHPKKDGYTWDIRQSDMAKQGSFPGEKSRRIDRILMRSRHWRPDMTRIIGTQPITPGNKNLFPSDHFGLLARFYRQGKQKEATLY